MVSRKIKVYKRFVFFSCILLIALVLPAGPLLAHGVALEYSGLSAIQIAARYDNGEPMADAQVAVFAPGNPAEPWLTGTTDSEGRFLFVPDPGIPGLWEVQVRLAGHGGLLRIEVEDGQFTASETAGFTNAQKALMVGSVIWGLIGTALFFSRRRS